MGALVFALDGDPDHTHLLIDYPDKLAVSALVDALKGTSRRVLRRFRRDLARRCEKGVLWHPCNCAASTGGATRKQYVEGQRASTTA